MDSFINNLVTREFNAIGNEVQASLEKKRDAKVSFQDVKKVLDAMGRDGVKERIVSKYAHLTLRELFLTHCRQFLAAQNAEYWNTVEAALTSNDISECSCPSCALKQGVYPVLLALVQAYRSGEDVNDEGAMMLFGFLRDAEANEIEEEMDMRKKIAGTLEKVLGSVGGRINGESLRDLIKKGRNGDSGMAIAGPFVLGPDGLQEMEDDESDPFLEMLKNGSGGNA